MDILLANLEYNLVVPGCVPWVISLSFLIEGNMGNETPSVLSYSEDTKTELPTFCLPDSHDVNDRLCLAYTPNTFQEKLLTSLKAKQSPKKR